jgi:hypothetical protein
MAIPWVTILFLLGFFAFLGILGVMKARRAKEKAYYTITGVALSVYLAIILVLLNQFILAFFVVILLGVFSAVMLPKMLSLYGKEVGEAQQETDFSTPLRMSELFSFTGVVKLERTYGYFKTVLIYSFLNMAVGGAIMLILNVLGVITTVMAVGYTIIVGILSVILFHSIIRKIFA